MTRKAQSGLTLFETLVMLAITALVGGVLMNVAARANAGNFARADRAIAASAVQVAETELRRAAARAASASGAVAMRGDPRRVVIETIAYDPCGASRIETVFAIEASAQGGALVRQCGAGPRTTLLRWPAGVRAAFDYSADGADWAAARGASPDRPDTEQSAFVRLSFAGARAPDLALVARVGGAVDDGRDGGPTPPPGAP